MAEVSSSTLLKFVGISGFVKITKASLRSDEIELPIILIAVTLVYTPEPHGRLNGVINKSEINTKQL